MGTRAVKAAEYQASRWYEAYMDYPDKKTDPFQNLELFSMFIYEPFSLQVM